MDKKNDEDIGSPAEVDEGALDQAAGGGGSGMSAGKVAFQDLHHVTGLGSEPGTQDLAAADGSDVSPEKKI